MKCRTVIQCSTVNMLYTSAKCISNALSANLQIHVSKVKVSGLIGLPTGCRLAVVLALVWVSLHLGHSCTPESGQLFDKFHVTVSTTQPLPWKLLFQIGKFPILKYFLVIVLFCDRTCRDHTTLGQGEGDFYQLAAMFFSFPRHSKVPHFLQKKMCLNHWCLYCSALLKVLSGFVAATAATRRGGAQWPAFVFHWTDCGCLVKDIALALVRSWFWLHMKGVRVAAWEQQVFVSQSPWKLTKIRSEICKGALRMPVSSIW